MKMQNGLKKLTIFVALVSGLIACSSKPEIKEFPDSANAKEEISNLDIALSNSKTEEYDLLAPESYKEAKNSLSEAKKLEKEDEDKEDVLKEVAYGRAYLERAKKNSDASRGKLVDVLAARQTAIDAKANTLLPKEFSKMDNKVKEETANYENDEEDMLKEKRSRFITGYMDLELAAIKQEHIGESKALIDDAIKHGARDLTPKTLSSANKKYKEADLYITQNRHNTAEIAAIAAIANEEARHLQALTAKARTLRGSSPEETALLMQSEEDRLNQTQDALYNEQDSNIALASSNAAMTKEQRLNSAYEEARKKFTPEEAEVYKQGDKLVIRLRSLQFPTSQAVIKGENFAVLKKVEDVIASFDSSKVLVEGHTDSTGGKAINQKVSEERAMAVKQYLQANAVDENTNFESKGFGFEKPLSSNKSASGRAQNRRVDVVIEPSKI